MLRHFMWGYVLCVPKRSLKDTKESGLRVALLLKGLHEATKYSDFHTLELQHPSITADSGHKGVMGTHTESRIKDMGNPRAGSPLLV